mmetsp:Transcript_39279/g.62214  ORF Transcript_39279/g.62214 Transcript_39279/m.62214 type:complete len:113 (-) Transcript_39279:15-353(-)
MGQSLPRSGKKKSPRIYHRIGCSCRLEMAIGHPAAIGKEARRALDLKEHITLQDVHYFHLHLNAMNYPRTVAVMGAGVKHGTIIGGRMASGIPIQVSNSGVLHHIDAILDAQ